MKRDPHAGAIRFIDLHAGMSFCLMTSSGQLAFLSLVDKNKSTFDLSWSATGWAMPEGGA